MSAKPSPARAQIMVPVDLAHATPEVIAMYGSCVEWLAQFAEKVAAQEDSPYTVEQIIEGFAKNVYAYVKPEKLN